MDEFGRLKTAWLCGILRILPTCPFIFYLFVEKVLNIYKYRNKSGLLGFMLYVLIDAWNKRKGDD